MITEWAGNAVPDVVPLFCISVRAARVTHCVNLKGAFLSCIHSWGTSSTADFIFRMQILRHLVPAPTTGCVGRQHLSGCSSCAQGQPEQKGPSEDPGPAGAAPCHRQDWGVAFHDRAQPVNGQLIYYHCQVWGPGGPSVLLRPERSLLNQWSAIIFRKWRDLS